MPVVLYYTDSAGKLHIREFSDARAMMAWAKGHSKEIEPLCTDSTGELARVAASK
jgi:hypothetical protein